MKTVTIVIFALLGLSAAIPARAELVFFSNGRSMSVKDHRTEGDSLVLTLRTGGEIVCDASVIARIAPDEVPYPEPQDSAAAPPQPPPPAVSGPNPYGEIIDRFSAEHGVDAKLVRAVIQVESGYKERARSSKGAMGLMQLMPATARQYRLIDPYDPRSNIEAGVRHLKTLLDRFPLQVALAAYNAGESAVERFRGVPPYPETRDYVSRILQLVRR